MRRLGPVEDARQAISGTSPSQGLRTAGQCGYLQPEGTLAAERRGSSAPRLHQSFDHHRRKLPHVGLAALQAPLHELVDVTMQAVRHLAPLSLSPSNIADKSLQVGETKQVSL